MTPEEKGALLLAHHEGKTIEYKNSQTPRFDWRECNEVPAWAGHCQYRVKPEPVVETITKYGNQSGFFQTQAGRCDTHKLTFNVVDGEIDCSSVKMEKL